MCSANLVVSSYKKNDMSGQTNTNFTVENISVKPNISSILTPIELEFSLNVWTCCAAQIDDVILLTIYLFSCYALTSQYYTINNTRTCVDYVPILEYFVINYISL